MSFADFQRRYRLLRSQLDAHQISPQAFAAQVNQLRLQDASGRWWQIDPQTGGWLAWNGAAWAPALPPSTSSATAPGSAQPLPAARSAARLHGIAPDHAPQGSGVSGALAEWRAGRKQPLAQRSQRWWDVTSILGGAAGGGLWMLWSSLRARLEGGVDILSPLLMLLLPVLLVTLRRPIDRLLLPLQAIRKRIPRIILVGAGLAAPLVISFLLYNKAGERNFPFLRWSVILGTLASYLIVRTPQVPSLMSRNKGGRP